VVGHDPEVLVDATHAAAIEPRLALEFAREQRLGLIDSVWLRGELALVSLIGDDLPAAVLTRTQEALAAERVECRRQMATPEVLSFLIPEAMLPRAVSRIHRDLVGRAPDASSRIHRDPVGRAPAVSHHPSPHDEKASKEKSVQ